MNISVTEFKHHCLEIIRRVEKTGKPVAITRRGKVVVRLNPSGSAAHGGLKPWEQLRALGGRLIAEPGESVLRDEDFEVPRRIVSRRSGRPAHRRNRPRARDAARGP
ncbi:MAG: type II toxin-antitoxin system prevent-host-death family antitoxin [Burkholderiales bacterium]|nr:type II toxin-antitoxin system prevent-host-death family antitoxin [Burkholderiales bacterium]